MNLTTEPLTKPVQRRARETYEALLEAAQDILEESGYEGLTSNTIVARAGLSPPAFYRYFKDKQMVLAILAQRLLDAQNELLEPYLSDVDSEFNASVDAVERLMNADVELTKSFKAGFQLMVLMRSLPELRELRIRSHQVISSIIAEDISEHYPDLNRTTLNARTRLATEMYYSTIEMLFETGFRQQKETVRRAAIGIEAALRSPE